MTISEYFSTRTPNATEIQTPYILAEAGVNHEGDFDLAKRLVNEAAEGGADGIKFQAYKAESLASRHSPAYWDLESSQLQASSNSSKSMMPLVKLNSKFCQSYVAK